LNFPYSRGSTAAKPEIEPPADRLLRAVWIRFLAQSIRYDREEPGDDEPEKAKHAHGVSPGGIGNIE
jgi:hypothetical protein